MTEAPERKPSPSTGRLPIAVTIGVGLAAGLIAREFWVKPKEADLASVLQLEQDALVAQRALLKRHHAQEIDLLMLSDSIARETACPSDLRSGTLQACAESNRHAGPRTARSPSVGNAL